MGILRSAAMAASFSTLCLTSALCPIAVAAQETDRRHYNLPAQPLSTSLQAVAVASKRSIAAPAELVRGITAPQLIGEFTAEEAVAALLEKSGLRYRRVQRALVVERDADFTQENWSSGDDATAIIVTGSRIRGAPIASPVITIDENDIRNAGQTTLGGVVRSIPQSFAGGQNPGIGSNVPALNGVDMGGGSSLNLRGLGSDATLTLLNGRRLSYSSSRQSVEVSTIPLGALDRIEIVADGASAIYGSDAVGGVANIILKRDMEGVETRARLGTSTEGGNFEQQYSAAGGARWASGGFIAAYEHNRNTAVDAGDREYARLRSPGLTLYPAMRNHNALLSAHQQISEPVTFSVDALFNKRRTTTGYATNPAGDLALGRNQQITQSRAFAIAPSLSVQVGAGWNAAFSGSYAEDRVDYSIDGYTDDQARRLAAGFYDNGAQSVELAADGPLLTLPAGSAEVAFGIGYRDIRFANDRGAGHPLNFERSQANRYAYGELSVPLAAPHMAIPAVHRLNVSAAVRYEHYDDAGSVATPKFGIVYTPTPGVDLKASWGRAFRAPTLYQRFQPPILTLLGAPSFGQTDAPPGSTALYIQGGNPDLRPERATTWSVTAALQPSVMPGFEAEISYFDIRYVDRIVTPIGFLSQSLSDPTYAAQVTRSPSRELIDSILSSGVFFQNGTGAPFDPANVIAFIDNSNVNAGRQWAHGIDLLASYRQALGAGDGEIRVSGNASYLVSHQQISEDQADQSLAGILFNPPRWRGRASATWSLDGLAVTGVANYSGELADPRVSPAAILPSQWRFDFTVRYRTGDTAPRGLQGLDLLFAVTNAFNAEPPPIFTTSVTHAPYDSTNYSPLGRVISFGIAKSW